VHEEATKFSKQGLLKTQKPFAFSNGFCFLALMKAAFFETEVQSLQL
jgi:hypothetical protein